MRDPDDPGMFSRDVTQAAADDTLDGFYDSLPSGWLGTGSAGSEVRRDGAVRPAGRAAAGVADAPAAPAAPPPASLPRTEMPPGFSTDAYAMSAAMTRLAEEKAELRRVAGDLHSRVEALQAQLWDAQRQLESQAAATAGTETVRVALSAEEERLKVGGRGWECNVVGAMHFGRSGASAVLTVSDPAYGSELITSLQAAESGDVVVLSSGARTYCTYAGHCAKIYGDADSHDFITMVWLGIRPG